MSSEMAGHEYRSSTNSSMPLETVDESSSTQYHSSTNMCMNHGVILVNPPPSGSLYLCTFDVPEELFFHPEAAMKLNGVDPRGLGRQKMFIVPMLSSKEEIVKKPARKQCRNCRAAAVGPNISLMNTQLIDVPLREPAQQNVRVVLRDGAKGWYITFPSSSQEVKQRRPTCGDCNVNGRQHLVRIPTGFDATIMMISTSQVLLHMLDRLPMEIHGSLLSKKEMTVKWTPMEFRDEEMLKCQPVGGSRTNSTGSALENLESGFFYEGFATYFKTRSQWSGRRNVYLGAFDPDELCMYIGKWKSDREAARANGLAVKLAFVTATPAQTVVSAT